MLRGTLIAQAASLCVTSWLFLACDTDPSFEITEEEQPEFATGSRGNRDLDAGAAGGAAGGCTTDDGLPCDSSDTTGGGTDGGGTDGGGTDGGGTDGGGTDGGGTDGGGTDGGGTDGGGTDGGGTDGGGTDGGGTDGGGTDGGGTDGGGTDGGGTDGGGTDGGGTDGGGTDGGMTLQGHEETFTVEGEEKPIDLVLTVDNSGSMTEEQAGLAQRIVDAFSHIQGADYRVALMSTDRNDGIKHFVDSASPGTFLEKMEGLKTAIQALGIRGSGTERGYEQSIKGLNADNPIQPGDQTWLRHGSIVATLIVSDEDNCSNGCAVENTNWIKGEFTALGRTPGDDARIYGLIRRNSSECRQAAHVGNQYMEGITQTNGIAGAICDTDYGPTLQRISADIGVIANTTFQLAHEPYPGTLEATINGVAYTGNVEINGNRVTLTDATLRPQDEVFIEYAYIVN